MSMARKGFLFLTLTLLLQTAHYLEHIAQVIQVYALGFYPKDAHGLLGHIFNEEWVHFAYNITLGLALISVYLYYRRNQESWLSSSRLGRFSLATVAILQGYHALEHIVKLYQHYFVPFYSFLHQPTHGLLPLATGWPIIPVHFWLNSFVWGLIVLAWWGLGRRRPVVSRLEMGRTDSWLPTSRRATALALVSAVLIAGALLARGARTVRVPEDFQSIQAAIDSVSSGRRIRIAAGDYAESLVISRPVALLGPEHGVATLLGDPCLPVVHIRDTHDVKLKGLTIIGGESGVLVERSQEVVIIENVIEGNRRFGIRVRNASASIIDNKVVGTLPPYGKGVHITNTMEWPGSLVQGNRVEDNAQEGILTNMSHVIIRDNIVRNNGLRGIAITEMSMANVENNIVMENVDVGLYVVDMSMAEIERNQIGGTRPGELGRAHAIRVEYYSDVWLLENLLDDRVVVWNNSQVNGDTGAWRGP